MMVIFHNFLQKIIECYIDDIAIKSQSKEYHIKDLKIIKLNEGLDESN